MAPSAIELESLTVLQLILIKVAEMDKTFGVIKAEDPCNVIVWSDYCNDISGLSNEMPNIFLMAVTKENIDY